MFTEDVELSNEEQQRARLIAIRAVDVKFTSAEHVEAWFANEAGGNVVLAEFAAYLLAYAREQAEQVLLGTILGALAEVLREE